MTEADMRAVTSHLPLRDEECDVTIHRHDRGHYVVVTHRPTGCYAGASSRLCGWTIEECEAKAKELVAGQIDYCEQYPDRPPKVQILSSGYGVEDLIERK